MATLDSLGTVRYFTEADPYHYTVDNRPILDLAGNDSILANAIDGLKADPTVFTWYQEGNFLPTLKFNNAAVGLAYSIQKGTYTKIGNRILFSLTITLASKGSSTGLAVISGLPFISKIGQSYAVDLEFNNMTNNTGDGMIMGSVLENNNVVNLYLINVATTTNTLVQLNDTYFTDTSSIVISGQYQI